MATVYKYLTGGRTVEHVDENDEYRPEDIKAHWAATFPELASATWDEGKDDEGRRVVTFAKKVGTKGGEAGEASQETTWIVERFVFGRWKELYNRVESEELARQLFTGAQQEHDRPLRLIKVVRSIVEQTQ